MSWGKNKRNWIALVADIQSEIDANRLIIPDDRISDIEHYLASCRVRDFTHRFVQAGGLGVMRTSIDP